MSMQESLILVATMLAPAFFSLIGMAALGCAAVAVSSEAAAKIKGRVFLDKYGQQVASMGAVLFPLFLVILIGSIGLASARFQQLASRLLAPDSPFIFSLAIMGVFTLLGPVYFLTWKKLRQSKGVHLLLGIGAALAAAAAVAVTVPAKLMAGLPPEAAQAGFGPGSMVWPMATMHVILCIVAAAGLSCVYLVLRRNRDDFGRDYYRFSLNLASRWAITTMLVFLACQGWLLAVLPDPLRTMTIDTPLGMVWAIGSALGLVCCAIWLVTARSQTPLRFKGLLLVAAGLLWLMHAANATLFMNFMTML
ncbi:hypothetical protein GKC30_14285 [Pseudodesulfovibrio sp. F-1]|uniref:Uncharacterized protein n=1 Tax=Pseudodesulfovibrio alkaliphilus TaxID=2661613 RepID=A0A7K1KS96_9BACT|nr:hypothetical protein [Pseudodesulfovibrio alkaliphilus]MUM78802.1 hypothetical protein [Pseudodesulfovibrio alkaliphilus]